MVPDSTTISSFTPIPMHKEKKQSLHKGGEKRVMKHLLALLALRKSMFSQCLNFIQHSSGCLPSYLKLFLSLF